MAHSLTDCGADEHVRVGETSRAVAECLTRAWRREHPTLIDHAGEVAMVTVTLGPLWCSSRSQDPALAVKSILISKVI